MVLLTIIIATQSAYAENKPRDNSKSGPATSNMIRQGRVELGGLFGLTSTTDLSDTNEMRARVGVYFTRELSLGASLSTSFKRKDTMSTIMADAQYHYFLQPKMATYLGGRAGFAYINEDDKDNGYSFGLGILGGVKFFHKEDMYWSMQIDDTRYFSHGGHTSVVLSGGLTKLF